MKIGRLVGAFGAFAGLALGAASASALKQEADFLSVPHGSHIGVITYSRAIRPTASPKSSFSIVLEPEVIALLLSVPPVTFAFLRQRRVCRK